MNQIELPDNYKRSLTSVLYIIESYIDDIYSLIKSDKKKSLLQIDDDITDEEKEKIISTTMEFKKEIFELKQKYNLIPLKFTIKQLINSKNTKIWEMLMDSRYERMIGYGKLNSEIINEYEIDIIRLLNLSELLNYGHNSERT